MRKEAIKLQLKRQCLSAAPQRTKTTNTPESDCTMEFKLGQKNAMYYSQNPETPVISLNRNAKSQHYFGSNIQRSEAFNRSDTTPLKRQHSILKKGNLKPLSKPQNSNNLKDSIQEHPENTLSRCFESNKMASPIYKIENKPNDFFTESRHMKMTLENNLKQTFSSSLINKGDHTDQFYTDSDIDEDHFENAVEINCARGKKRNP